MIKKTNHHGGAREGAGRQLKYGEPTERIYLNVPSSKKEEIAEKIKVILKKFEVKKK